MSEHKDHQEQVRAALYDGGLDLLAALRQHRNEQARADILCDWLCRELRQQPDTALGTLMLAIEMIREADGPL